MGDKIPYIAEDGIYKKDMKDSYMLIMQKQF